MPIPPFIRSDSAFRSVSKQRKNDTRSRWLIKRMYGTLPMDLVLLLETSDRRINRSRAIRRLFKDGKCNYNLEEISYNRIMYYLFYFSEFRNSDSTCLTVIVLFLFYLNYSVINHNTIFSCLKIQKRFKAIENA